jgi:hypothetical protein
VCRESAGRERARRARVCERATKIREREKERVKKGTEASPVPTLNCAPPVVIFSNMPAFSSSSGRKSLVSGMAACFNSVLTSPGHGRMLQFSAYIASILARRDRTQKWEHTHTNVGLVRTATCFTSAYACFFFAAAMHFFAAAIHKNPQGT